MKLCMSDCADVCGNHYDQYNYTIRNNLATYTNRNNQYNHTNMNKQPITVTHKKNELLLHKKKNAIQSNLAVSNSYISITQLRPAQV